MQKKQAILVVVEQHCSCAITTFQEILLCVLTSLISTLLLVLTYMLCYGIAKQGDLQFLTTGTNGASAPKLQLIKGSCLLCKKRRCASIDFRKWCGFSGYRDYSSGRYGSYTGSDAVLFALANVVTMMFIRISTCWSRYSSLFVSQPSSLAC